MMQKMTSMIPEEGINPTHGTKSGINSEDVCSYEEVNIYVNTGKIHNQ